MEKMSIQQDQGIVRLTKSKRLVGLRRTPSRDLTPPSYIKKEIHPFMGGFQLVELESGTASLDEALDEVRQREDVELGTHVYFQEGSDRPIVPTGDIFLLFETGVSEQEQLLVLDEFHLELIERKGAAELLARVTPQSYNPIRVAEMARKSCLVRQATPDYDTILDEYALSLPSDSLLSHQWHLQNNGFIPDAAAPMVRGADARIVSAWKRLDSLGSPQITIAVIDNGFDLSHPDFQGKIVHPFDFWYNSPNIPQNNEDFTHGTPCASLAIAAANGFGMIGAAPNARFMPIHGTSYSSAKTEQMFDYCIAHGADIISCSWGTTDPNGQLDTIKKQAIARAARYGRNGKGCVILFAAGNEQKSYLNYYAIHPDVIAVGASTSIDDFADYSNQGMEIAVCAPSNGEWPLLAARASWDPGDKTKLGENRFWKDGRSRGIHYKHFGGTSGATPIVAGICALILSANPELTAAQVKEILISTADKIGPAAEYFGGHSRKFGYGRVNAERAVLEALRRRGTNTGANIPSSPPPVTPSPTPPAKGWSVQCGAYTVETAANGQKQLLSRFGVPVFISVKTENGKTIYRVLAGNFPNASQAASFQTQLNQNGITGFVKSLADL